ncbi:MAG TPA: metal-sensitive transcriptional regulator [Thermotogota bacterium]|jgi:DNA-binding FrmR family transcriptional regulator|nr:metal-sensitive transcriptional regulator [Thermotogota bacterium]NLH18718.1 metal-sensitive transcriptional regulator [Thermotogaceae bacterium]OQC31350.1 MAG: Copper-sensing transcriptional repressor CsoR [Thermotogota bacterium ADurb.Bin062]HNW46926.1 metal-sensitive transcriptional regulator [Thermotogota bacterium]HNY81374.1 metal-sensitive transcriptional regulator [Thermotogota bacterium]
MENERLKPIIVRLKKIEGQVRGLQRMIETDKPCASILAQVSAVQAALRMVGRKILEHYAYICLDDVQRLATQYQGAASEKEWEKSAPSSAMKEKLEALSELIGQLMSSESLPQPLSEGEKE